MESWTLVKVKLPEMGERVLLQTSSNMVVIGDYVGGGFRTDWSRWEETESGNKLSLMAVKDVKNWMPLPKCKE